MTSNRVSNSIYNQSATKYHNNSNNLMMNSSNNRSISKTSGQSASAISNGGSASAKSSNIQPATDIPQNLSIKMSAEKEKKYVEKVK